MYPSRAVEVILGPQLRSGSPLNPWPWFDSNAASSGRTVGRNFPSKVPRAVLTGTAAVAHNGTVVTVAGGNLSAELADNNRLYIRRPDPARAGQTWWGDPFEITAIDYAGGKITIDPAWPEPGVAGAAFSSDQTTRYANSDSTQVAAYWNYYDQAACQYLNYYRTGDPEFLALARKVADVWWAQLQAGGGDIHAHNPRSISLSGLMLRALDGKPEYWDFIDRYTRYHLNQWVMTRKSYPGLYFGVRDGSYALLYALYLSQALPASFADKKAAYLRDAVDASVNYYVRLQYPDGSWRWQDDWDFDGNNSVEDDGLAQLSFHVGLLLHALVDVHRIIDSNPAYRVQAAKIKASILKSCDNLWDMRIEAPVKGYGTPLRWRSFQYQLYSVVAPAVTVPVYNGDTNMVRDYRHNASTIPHAYGYAFHLTGEARYRERGDELLAASFGNGVGPGADASRGLADYTAPDGGRRAKEYNENYRTSGRYLAYRLLAPGHNLPVADSPATATSTSTPLGEVTPSSLNLVSLALTSSRKMASSPTLSEVQVNALVEQIEEAMKLFKSDVSNFAAPENILTELQAAHSHAQNALTQVKAGSEFMDDAKMRISWAGARLKRAKDRMILKSTP